MNQQKRRASGAINLGLSALSGNIGWDFASVTDFESGCIAVDAVR